MRTAITDEQRIDATPEAVWRALTDWDGARHWMPGVESMAADGPLETGTVVRFLARGKERISTVAALDPGRAITLRSEVGGVTADYAYAIRPAADPGGGADFGAGGAGSLVRLEAGVATSGITTLFAPLIRRAIAREDGVQLERLKEWIERPVSSAHG